MEGDCTSLRFSFAFSGHFECYRDLSSARESLLPIYLLSMRDNASIQVKNATRDIQFIWRGFDGDDCFADFQIVATTEDGTEEFDFGPCVVWGLRELSRLFRGGSRSSAGLGFRNPEVRCCDVLRLADGYSIKVQLDEGRFSREFVLQEPSLHIQDEFLAEYDE